MSALAVAFRLQVVRPTIRRLGLWSEAAENLLLMTAAHESGGWTFCRQHPAGPALGFYQMEPATLADLFAWLKLKPKWRDLMSREFHAIEPQPDRLVFDPLYATACARMQFYRRPEPLPAPENEPELGEYAKRWWNSLAGKATVDQYVEAYRRHTLQA